MPGVWVSGSRRVQIDTTAHADLGIVSLTSSGALPDSVGSGRSFSLVSWTSERDSRDNARCERGEPVWPSSKALGW